MSRVGSSVAGVSRGGGAGPVGAGRAHAKVIVLGEHAVVYGAPALALPVPQLTVTASARWPADGADGSGEVSFTTPIPATGTPTGAAATSTAGAQAGSVVGGAPEGLRALVGEFAVLAGVSGRRGPQVVIEGGGVPHGRGLGSSAACARAVVLALADLHGVQVTEEDVFALVQSAENVAHGRSSGVDARAVGASGPLWFTAGQVQRVDIGCQAVFVIADSGTVGRTKDAVERLRTGFDQHPGSQDHFVQHATRLTEQARHALAAGRPEDLGTRLTGYHDLLHTAGLSTPGIDRLVTTALDAGSLGAKITGGGLGGCMIALTHPANTTRLTARLHHAGAAQTWAVPLRGPANHAP